MRSVDTLLTEIEEQIQKKHLLKHPFYQAWSHGTLKRACLKEYANEYYHHVKAFPTYLSALHAHTEEMSTRKALLQNLIEEEAGYPNHPELWMSFAKHLGSSEKEIAQHIPCREIQTLIELFRTICREGQVAEGLAALYAYESQIPEICQSKIEGLKNHYGMCDPIQWSYFSIHIEADKEHAKVERELLSRHIHMDQASKVQDTVEHVLDALWNFLTHMCRIHQIAC